MERVLVLIGLVTVLAMGEAFAQETTEAPIAPIWITLGTHGGPISSPDRSQPANVIVIGHDAFLVDVGAGATQQLAKANISLAQVKAMFLSHLHFDHIGGLSAVIGLRNQLGAPEIIEVYGPPGTRMLVEGLVAATVPSAQAGFGYLGMPFENPLESVKVIELVDGSIVDVGSMRVSARQNSHYSFAPGSEMDQRVKSLSFRFDAPGRSIVYTGDTGPSAAVEELAEGADLLVAEMIDLNLVTPHLMPNATGQDMMRHLREHHITPEQVGELAENAHVGSLVITHLVAPAATTADLMRYAAIIKARYSGAIMIANDLDEF